MHNQSEDCTKDFSASYGHAVTGLTKPRLCPSSSGLAPSFSGFVIRWPKSWGFTIPIPSQKAVPYAAVAQQPPKVLRKSRLRRDKPNQKANASDTKVPTDPKNPKDLRPVQMGFTVSHGLAVTKPNNQLGRICNPTAIKPGICRSATPLLPQRGLKNPQLDAAAPLLPTNL